MDVFISIIILTVYFILYGVVHSWLASASVKSWASATFGPLADRWYRLVYNIIATVTLLPMFVLMAVLPGQTLYVVPPPWRWLMLAGQMLALAAGAITLFQTGAFHFLGISQLFSQQPSEEKTLTLNGFYAWVRHPLYTFGIIFLWLTPVMTTNVLTAYVLFTLYFYFGSIYEERRLLAQFGDAYARYQQQVPRLIPRPGRRYSESYDPR